MQENIKTHFYSNLTNKGILFRYLSMLLLVVTMNLNTFSSPAVNGSMPDKDGTTEQPRQKEITGTVYDPDANPLIGATVVAQGTTIGTITDVNGNFRLMVPNETTVLIISYVGMQTQEVDITDMVNVTVQFTSDAIEMEEVVVVGFGTQKKATVTGSISSMSQTELLQTPVTNISNMLVGRLTGLLAVQRTGQPGEDASDIRIRGSGTFTGSTSPLILVDGIETENYDNIDPNEIESITILKDASATAVYGVRGANGVLIITTRRGREGKPQFSFSSQVAVSQFTEIRRSMSSYDYARLFNEALKYDTYVSGTYNERFSEEEIAKFKSGEDPIFYPDMDWFPEIFGGYNTEMQHNLNISGGTELVKYFVSVGHFAQNGLINHVDIMDDYDAQPWYKRYNIRSNFDFDITKRLSASINISSQIDNINGRQGGYGAVFHQAFNANPTSSPGVVDGKFLTLAAPRSTGTQGSGPLGTLLSDGQDRQHRNYLNSSLRVNYDLGFITEGLSTHLTLSYNNFHSHRRMHRNWSFIVYEPVRTVDEVSGDETILYLPQNEPVPYLFSEQTSKNRKDYLEAGLNYNREFGNHNITGLLLYNQSKYHAPNLAFLVPNAYQGLVGRATYDFGGRYLAEVNLGYNGTENFALGRRFGFFPAFSLGWVLTEEAFFPANNLITLLKIRGSYGEVGNDKVGGERFLYRDAVYQYTTNTADRHRHTYRFGEYGSTYTDYQTSWEGTLGNEFLTWERAAKSNLGLEVNFFRDKFRLTGDVFHEYRDNILAQRNTDPFVIAAQLPLYNMGEMENKGFDGDIVYYDRVGRLNFWIRGNYTFARNKIIFQDELERPFSYQYRTGQSLGQMYGLVWEGFYNTWEEVNDVNRPVSNWDNDRIQPGDMKYVDLNGDGIINNDDAVPIGYPNFPEKIYGFSFGGSFGLFDFSVLFQGAGNVSVNLFHPTIYRPFVQNRGGADYMVESWTHERYEQGLPIRFMRYSADLNQGHNTQNSNFKIVDASYLRFKNAEIGFFVPERMYQRLGISSARFYINGNNLFTWHKLLPGLDPESTAAYGTNIAPYPVTRRVNLGVNVRF